MNKIYFPFVSIAVCTFNRGDDINPCLDSLRGQLYPKDRYEIIVIDDASTDKTQQVLKADDDIRLIRHEVNKGIGAARNTALDAARGEILAYIDDDAIADPHWLERLVAPLADASLTATGGRTFAYKTDHLAERYLAAIEYGNPAPLAFGKSKNPLWRFWVYLKNMFSPVAISKKPVEVQAVYSLNCAFRTAALRAVGGFDAKLSADEDSEISTRLRSTGARIIFIPDAIIHHRHREHVIKLLRQTYYRAENTVYYYAKEKKILPLFPLPFLYLALAIILLIINPIIGIISILIAPLVLYSWWIVKAFQFGKGEYILYGYIQLALESAAIVGMARGLVMSS